MAQDPNFRVARFYATADQWRARYMRMQFTPGTVGLEAGMKDVVPPGVTIPNSIGIALRDPPTRFAAIGECIYCGAPELRPGSGLPLSEEHIIAEGLGGTLIIPEASCASCAKITGGTEGKILRTSLFATRARMGIRGKKRKRPHGQNYPATTVVGGKDVTIILPIDVHPTVLFMLGFHQPRFLLGERKRDSDIAGLWTHFMGTPDVALKGGAEAVTSPSFDTVRFCQLIAKIAHGFAVAKIGLANFRPLLRAFILREFGSAEQYPGCFELVGGYPSLVAPSDDLHTLGYQIVPFKGSRYLIVFVRLFAGLGAPIYNAVVGEMASERR